MCKSIFCRWKPRCSSHLSLHLSVAIWLEGPSTPVFYRWRNNRRETKGQKADLPQDALPSALVWKWLRIGMSHLEWLLLISSKCPKLFVKVRKNLRQGRGLSQPGECHRQHPVVWGEPTVQSCPLTARTCCAVSFAIATTCLLCRPG